MIPVRVSGLPSIARDDIDIASDHPLYGTTCPACDEPMFDENLDRVPVALVYIGPGADSEDQWKARQDGGPWFTGAAVCVHRACAGVES